MAAQQLASRSPASDIKLAKVDATEEPDLAAKFDVGGYPTLKFFKNNDDTPIEYGGGRTKDEFINWLDKKSGPPAEAVQGKAAAEAFQAGNDVAVVAFQDNSTVFVGAADQVDNYKFGLLDADAAAELGVEQVQIVPLKTSDDKKSHLRWRGVH